MELGIYRPIGRILESRYMEETSSITAGYELEKILGLSKY